MINLYYSIYKKSFYKIIYVFQVVFSFFFKRKFHDANLKKIGILLQWGIGDSIIAHPLIYFINKKYPNAKIFIIGKKFNKYLYKYDYENINYIELVPPWAKSKKKYLTIDYLVFIKKILQIKKNKFDLLVSTRFDFRDNLQIFMMQPDQSLSFSYNSFCNTHKISYLEYLKKNEYKLIKDFIKPLGNLDTNFFYFSKFKNTSVSDFLKKVRIKNNDYIVFQGGASDAYKNICFDCSKSTLAKILKNKNVVIVKDSSYKYELFYDFFRKCSIKTFIFSGNLSDVGAIIGSSKLFIGADSGLIHLANSLKVKCFGFYLNKQQISKWKPPDPNIEFYTNYLHYKNCRSLPLDRRLYNFNSKLNEDALIKELAKKI